MEAKDIKDESAIITREKEKIHAEAVARMDIITNAEADDREEGENETLFANVRGHQWDDNAKKARSGRPMYELNYVGNGISILIGDQRQTEVGPKITPLGNGASEDIAKIYRGIIRNIESVSNAQSAYDQACDETYCSRYGGWRIKTEYESDYSFDQCIKIVPVGSAVTSMYFDPSAEQYDKSDAMFGFMVTNLHRKMYEAKYPGTTPVDFQVSQYKSRYNGCFNWYDHDNVVVAEYFRKVPTTIMIYLLSNKTAIAKDDYEIVKDELLEKGINLVLEDGQPKSRKVKTYQIERYVLNGHEIIEDKKIWPGKYIPLIPQYGKSTKIGEHTYYKSVVTDAQDPQRILNYAKSTKTEVLALGPKDKIWMTPAQAKGHTSTLEKMNTNNSPIQFFNPDPQLPGSPAQNRMGPPAVQQGLIELVSDSKNDVVSLTGVVPTQQQGVMGEDVDLRSGKAMREQNIRSDTGNYVYWDNHLKSRVYSFKVLMDLIPRIYDNERQVRLLKKDGSEEMVTINQVIKDPATNKEVILNDITSGDYQVDISTGKAYATQRLEAADKMESLVEKIPGLQDIAADIIVESIDLPGSDELYERVRKQMIKKGLVKPTKDEEKEFGSELNQGPSEADLAQMDDIKATTDLKKAQSAELLANAKAKTAAIEKDRSITHKNIVDAYNKYLESIKMKEEMNLPITLEDQQNLIGETQIVEDSQEDIMSQPNQKDMQQGQMVDNQSNIM